jgi:hypothetical protein
MQEIPHRFELVIEVASEFKRRSAVFRMPDPECTGSANTADQIVAQIGRRIADKTDVEASLIVLVAESVYATALGARDPDDVLIRQRI